MSEATTNANMAATGIVTRVEALGYRSLRHVAQDLRPFKGIEVVVQAVLSRSQSLGIRPIQAHVLRHPQRDSACYHDPLGLLRGFVDEADHGLVIFDRAWEGAPAGSRPPER